jgi:hypothetical protein
VQLTDQDLLTSEQLKQTGAAILELDYLDERTIKAAAEAYGSGPLDLLINVGGKRARLFSPIVPLPGRQWLSFMSSKLLGRSQITGMSTPGRGF